MVFNFANDKKKRGELKLTIEKKIPHTYTEPMTAKEPLDESLAYQTEEARKELEHATQAFVKTCSQATKVMTELVETMVDAESKEALQATIVPSSQYEDRAEKMDKEDVKIVESDYDEAMHMLSQLDKSVASNLSKFKNIEYVLNNNK